MKVKKAKWLAVLVVVAMLVTLVPVMGLAGQTNGSGSCGPLVVRLFAGQNLDVGSVTVTNDAVNINVVYELDQWAIAEGWEITETHLYIGKNKPPTSAPGQLPYDDDDAVYASGKVTYSIPLADIDAYTMRLNSQNRSTGVMIPYGDPGVTPCEDDVYIAAHAVIERTVCETVSGTITPDLTWIRSSESIVASFPGYGAGWTPTEGFNIGLDPNELVWDGGTAAQNFLGYSNRSDISWASWDYAASVPRGGAYAGYSDLRRFNATFELTAEQAANINSATLQMPGFSPAAIPINDNIYIFLNGVDGLVFWGGTRVTGAAGNLTQFQGIVGVPAIPTFNEPDWGGLDFTGWYIPGQFPDLDIANFKAGLNNLDVFTEENQEGGGMAELELTLEYAVKDCTTFDETAWGKGTNFGTNWAMYFKYKICVAN